MSTCRSQPRSAPVTASPEAVFAGFAETGTAAVLTERHLLLQVRDMDQDGKEAVKKVSVIQLTRKEGSGGGHAARCLRAVLSERSSLCDDLYEPEVSAMHAEQAMLKLHKHCKIRCDSDEASRASQPPVGRTPPHRSTGLVSCRRWILRLDTFRISMPTRRYTPASAASDSDSLFDSETSSVESDTRSRQRRNDGARRSSGGRRSRRRDERYHSLGEVSPQQPLLDDGSDVRSGADREKDGDGTTAKVRCF